MAKARPLAGVAAAERRMTGSGTRPLRYAVAAVCAACAAVYLAIGVGAVQVVEPAAGEPGLLGFGLTAGGAYALGAFLSARYERRPVWLAGAAFQLLALAMYVAVAPQRTPPYEVWGVSLKVAQALVLVALLYLALRPAAARRRAKGTGAAR